MTNRIQLREILAWTVVLLAMVLFSATVAFAQSTWVNVTNNDGKVHVKVQSVENGKTVTRDTTFEARENTDVDEIVDRFAGLDHDTYKSKHADKDDHDKNEKRKRVTIDMDIPHMTDADRDKINEEIRQSMDDMRKGLKEMHKSLQSMHFDINGEPMDFNFDFDTDDDSQHLMMDDELDSLRDSNHVIIIGDENEKAPELEKVFTKNGKQVFVYKRINPDSGKGEQWIEDFTCFPNPTSGKIIINFKSENPENLSLSITDAKGKSVYSEKLDSFSGRFSKEINLTQYGKGNYMLTVSDADNSMTKKIVVN